MKSFRFVLTLVPCLFLAGCLDVEKTVTVKPDGSGTVIETVVLSKAVLEQMKGMAAAFGGKGDDAMKGFDLSDEKKAKEEAGKMGEGVTFVSAKKVSTEKGEGATVTFTFKDINKLKIDQNPSSSAPKTPGGAAGGPSKVEPITFAFTKGAPAQLTVRMPKPALDKKAKPAPDAAGMEEMAMQMAQQMFKDMRIRIAIAVAGKIVETNAEYHDDSRVTLMEMDFNKLLANPEKMKALSKANPQSLEEMKALVKGLDGVKVETAPEVKVKFQ
jgi:hypothetical protein